MFCRLTTDFELDGKGRGFKRCLHTLCCRKGLCTVQLDLSWISFIMPLVDGLCISVFLKISNSKSNPASEISFHMTLKQFFFTKKTIVVVG